MNNSLICYMDILGFSSSIRKLNEQEIKKVLESLEEVSKFFDVVKPLQQKHMTIESDMNIELLEHMSLDVFNDSILIIGDFPDNSLAGRRWGQEPTQFHFWQLFLFACAYIYFMIFCDLKLVSRGAIVCGTYQRARGKNFNAVLSSAIVDAVNLEKKEAVYPRIIMGDSALQKIDTMSEYGPELKSEYLLEDKDGKKYLDVWKLTYSKFSNSGTIILFKAAYDLIGKQPFDEKDRPKYEWLKSYFGSKGV